MPGFIVQTGPFPTGNMVTELVRAEIDDMLDSNSAGYDFVNSLPQVLPLVNNAIGKLSAQLTLNGIEDIERREILWNVPSAPNPADPNSQIRINYNGSWDGQKNYPNPRLPADLVEPQTVAYQLSGTTNPFSRIRPASDGLLPQPITWRLCQWDFFDHAIWINGLTQPVNLEVRYLTRLRGLKNLTEIIPVIGSLEPLAYWVAAEWTASRGGLASGASARFEQQALDLVNNNIVQRTVQRQQRGIFVRRYRRGGYGAYGGSFGGY